MNMSVLHDNKEFLISCAVALVCAGLFLYFPTTGLFDTLIASGVFLVGIPLLYGSIILKRQARTWHLTRGHWDKKAVRVTGVAILGAILLIAALLQSDNFVANYGNGLPSEIFDGFGSFLLYELIVLGILLAFIEFFFRGFVMTLLRERYGVIAITLQTILFTVFLFLDQVSLWNILPLIILSFGAGAIAYYTRSVYYSFLYILFTSIMFDALIINTLA